MAAPARPGLTEKQAEVLDHVIAHVAEFGYQPTAREMAERFGVTHRAVMDRIAHLANKGYVELPPTRSERCLRLTMVRFEPVFAPGDPAPPAAPTDRRPEAAAARAAMAAFLGECDNAWTATAVLAEAAGVDAHAARVALSDAPPGQFESRPQGAGKLWRLAPTPAGS
jgi:DNA-binding transcriptional MocR family regulator